MIASSYLACVGGGASLSHSSHVQSTLVYPAQTVTEVTVVTLHWAPSFAVQAPPGPPSAWRRWRRSLSAARVGRTERVAPRLAPRPG